MPPAQALRTGERFPQVLDIGVVAVLDAYDADAARRSEAAEAAIRS
jgi:hypothetical protein